MATDFSTPGDAVTIRNLSEGSQTVKVTYDAGETAVDVSVTGALELVAIPAGAYVSEVLINVETAEVDGSNTVVLDIGDATDPDGWSVDADAETTGVTKDVDAAYMATWGKYYATADTIDVTPSHDLALCKFTVIVNYFMV